MRKDVAEAWVKDLRANPDKQAKERLFDGQGYCCLGRLCVVLGFEFTQQEFDDKFVVSGTTEGGELPSEVADAAGMWTPYGAFQENFKIVSVGGDEHDSLVDLNDEAGYSFNEIADVIERNWEKL